MWVCSSFVTDTAFVESVSERSSIATGLVRGACLIHDYVIYDLKSRFIPQSWCARVSAPSRWTTASGRSLTDLAMNTEPRSHLAVTPVTTGSAPPISTVRLMGRGAGGTKGRAARVSLALSLEFNVPWLWLTWPVYTNLLGFNCLLHVICQHCFYCLAKQSAGLEALVLNVHYGVCRTVLAGGYV